MKRVIIIIVCITILIVLSAVQASLEEKRLRVYYKQFQQEEVDQK